MTPIELNAMWFFIAYISAAEFVRPLIVSLEHFSKTSLSISVTLPGTVISVMPVQFANAPVLMVLTPSFRTKMDIV